jgi:hypothetical protein
VAVVSDGVGSCPRSREGAESVVQTSLDTIEQAILGGINTLESPASHWKAWIATSIERNRKKLTKLLKEPESEFSLERKIRDLFSATQLLAWTDGKTLVTSIVGDGAIIGVRREDSGNLRFDNLVDVNKQGMSNEVIPVTLSNWERGWLFRGPDSCVSFEGVILVTDGYSDSAGDAFWRYLWESLINMPATTAIEGNTTKGETVDATDNLETDSSKITQNLLSTPERMDPRESFLQAFSRQLESRGYSSDDKTMILIRFL